jgi:putative ABC transport system permease protein
MKTFDIIHLAALNLYRRWARTLLTVIGVIIGTASITIMVAIGFTNLVQFGEMLEGAELTKIEVMGSSMANYSGIDTNIVKLDDAAVTALGNIEHVDMIVPVKNLQMYAKVERYYANYLHVMAVPAHSLPQLVELKEGCYPTEDSFMPEIIMGMGVAREFIQKEDDYRNREYEGPSIDWLNTTLNMYFGGKYVFDNPDMPSSREYRANVVGIIKDRDEKNPSYDIYISLDKGKRILQENYKLANELKQQANTYDIAYVYADRMENVIGVLDKIRSYGFEAFSDTQWIEEMQKQQRAQQGQLAAMGLISLVVSAIGIANTMMTGVLERRKEIGVMKVVGVAIPKIRLLFLVEAAMIGLLGGLAGVLLSHLFSYTLSTGTQEAVFLGMHFSAGIKIIIPLWLDMAAMGIAVVVGVIAGIFPAKKATKMSPLEAIRG